MKQTLSRKFTFVVVLTVLIAVGFVSLISSFFIHDRFKDYIIEKQTQTINQIVAQVSLQYDANNQAWDTDNVHEIGMVALSSGYIIQVYNQDSMPVWDAEAYDMSACVQVINDISHRMLSQFPNQSGSFISSDYLLEYKENEIGKVTIQYFGPYFYQLDDLNFINQLQSLLWIVALVSILLSIFVGIFFSKSLSKPILKTINATREIVKGKYGSEIQDKTNISELSELIDSINYLSTSLSEQDRIKRQITSDVAHELRTPLSTLMINIEAVRDGIVELDSNRLKSLHDEVIRLTNIVKDLEQLTQIENIDSKLAYTHFNLKELLQECITSLEHKQKEKLINTKLNSIDIEIDGDRNKLFQVFYNLILNAYVYSSQKSSLSIDMMKDSKNITIQLKDTGYGIPTESLPYIFERFYRVDSSRTRNSGGSGIGLTIVKRIVEAHKGEIHVESTIDLGTTFTLILPIQQSS